MSVGVPRQELADTELDNALKWELDAKKLRPKRRPLLLKAAKAVHSLLPISGRHPAESDWMRRRDTF